MKPLAAIITLIVPVALLVTGGLVTRSILNPPDENVFIGKSGDELSYMKGIGRYCYTINSDKTACKLFLDAYVKEKGRPLNTLAMAQENITDAGRDFRASVDSQAQNKPLAVKAAESVFKAVTGQ